MNGQITKLAVATLVLLCSLIVATTYWQTWAVAGLDDRQDNSIALDREKAFDRVIVPEEAFEELNTAYSRGDHVAHVGSLRPLHGEHVLHQAEEAW